MEFNVHGHHDYCNKKTMKYKCIKSDPLGWIQKGRVYDIQHEIGDYYIVGDGFVVTSQSMKEMFKPIEPK